MTSPDQPLLALVHHEEAETLARHIAALAPDLHLELAADPDALAQASQRADIILTGRLPAGFVFPPSGVTWLQSTSSGIDYLIPMLTNLPDVLICNAKGLHADAMADYAFCMMTALLIDLPRLQREQAARVWSPRSVPTLRSRSLAVLGQGPVGLEIARRGADLGMRVTAVSRSGDSGPDGLAARRPVEALHEILPDSDVVVLALPSTPQTRHLIDADALALMRPDAILVNIARGAVVDEAALVAALQESRLGAAALDVFEQEPLAADSPLWAMPNVIITPHMSGNPADFCASMAHLFVDNYRRFRDGTDLLNVVDWRRGY